MESDGAQPSIEEPSASLRKRESVKHDRVRVDDIGKIFSSFKEAMDKEDWGPIKYLLEDTIYMINTDTGGQTQFLD